MSSGVLDKERVEQLRCRSWNDCERDMDERVSDAGERITTANKEPDQEKWWE